MKKVNIIVPVYADWASLKENIASLKKYYINNDYVKVYYTNDCGPEADELEKRIKRAIANSDNFYYFRNKNNLGFVKNCNNTVENIIDKNGDVLLLNSDTKVTKNFLQEMQRVLYSEKNIGIVNPRSNNATVWSVPMDRRYAFKPQKSYKYWQDLKNHIPDKYIAPTSHGFCMLIRRNVINDIGLFDEIFGKGFGEENDFTLRAKKKGWLCAVANHAFVFHYESRSFGNEQREKLSANNMKIIRKRYPDYESSIREYLEAINENFVNDSRLWVYFQLFVKAMNYGHGHGYKRMAKKGSSVVYRRIKKKSIHSSRVPGIHVWAHEVTYTGAPIVLFDLLEQWKQKYPDITDISYHMPLGGRTDTTLLEDLREKGYDFITETPVDVTFVSGDIVILNSSAFPDWLYGKIFNGLKSGDIKHLYYYIHEDSEKWVGLITKYRQLMHDLILDDKVTVYAPSKGSVKNWQHFIGVKDNIFVMSGRVTFEEGMLVPKLADDFNKINFIIAGSSEPRKGQLNVVNALACVNDIYFSKAKHYRDYSVIIAGTKDDGIFYNKFIENAAKSLKGKIKLVNKPTITEMHKLMSGCNFTITYSISESFSITTMEGMAYGHPIIRSECSGVDEQLRAGGNGFLVSTNSFVELVDAIETVLNKEKTSNQQLARMSEESVKIARDNIASQYRLIDDVMEEVA